MVWETVSTKRAVRMTCLCRGYFWSFFFFLPELELQGSLHWWIFLYVYDCSSAIQVVTYWLQEFVFFFLLPPWVRISGVAVLVRFLYIWLFICHTGCHILTSGIPFVLYDIVQCCEDTVGVNLRYTMKISFIINIIIITHGQVYELCVCAGCVLSSLWTAAQSVRSVYTSVKVPIAWVLDLAATSSRDTQMAVFRYPWLWISDVIEIRISEVPYCNG